MKLFYLLYFLPFILFGDQPFYSFTIPKKWEIVSIKDFASSVKIGCVGKSKKTIKPSLNLATEKTSVTFEKYIQAVKDRHIADRKNSYTSLGFLETPYHKAHLAQIDTLTKCGNVRMLQCIFFENQTAYILTGVCEKEDFYDKQQQFISIFESFSLSKDPFETISDKTKSTQLANRVQNIQKAWKELKSSDKNTDINKLFLNKKFQKIYWKPLEKFLTKTFKDKGLVWHIQVSSYLKSQVCT